MGFVPEENSGKFVPEQASPSGRFVPEKLPTDSDFKKGIEEGSPLNYLNPMNLARGIGVLFKRNDPVEVYKKSVEQAFQPSSIQPQIPRLPTEGLTQDIDPTGAAGVLGAVANTGSGLVNTATAPATPQLLLNPLAQIYAAPYFAIKALESGRETVDAASRADVTSAQLAENFLSTVLNTAGAAGGVAGGKIAKDVAVKGETAKAEAIKPPEPKSPITDALANATKTDSLVASNVEANKLALSPTTSAEDSASTFIGQGVLTSFPKDAAESASVLKDAPELPMVKPRLKSLKNPEALMEKINPEKLEYLKELKATREITQEEFDTQLQESALEAIQSDLEASKTISRVLPRDEAVMAANRNKYPPVEFTGTQVWGEGLPDTTLWTLTQDIPGHPKGTTVDSGLLRDLGYKVPDVPAEAEIAKPQGVTPEKPTETTFGNARFRKQDGDWYYEYGAKVDSPGLIAMLDDSIGIKRPEAHPMYDQVKDAYKQGDYQKVVQLANQMAGKNPTPTGAIGNVLPPPPAKPAVPQGNPLNNPNPAYTYKQGLSRWLPFSVAKEVVGTTSANIEAASKPVFGVLRRMEKELSDLRTRWHDANMTLSDLTRKQLNPADFARLDLAILNGDFETARSIMTPEMNKAFDAALKNSDEMYNLSVESGREINKLANHWPRKLIDYNEFRKEVLGADEASRIDNAIRSAEKERGSPLTPSERENLVNTMISADLRGRPSFLKPRTINEIKSNWLKYYEPFDVSMDSRINQVSRDIINRKYTGKFDGTGLYSSYVGPGGEFGKIIAQEKAAGRLNAKAEDILVKNIQSRINSTADFDSAIVKMSNKIRSAQTALFLGDATTAMVQFADIISNLRKYGPRATAKATFGKRLVKLEDIGLHEGNPETSMFSRSPNNTLLKRLVNKNLKTTIEWADKYNKEQSLNAAIRYTADAVRPQKIKLVKNGTVQTVYQNPTSPRFIELNRKYSQRFPQDWPNILKELQSHDFAKGKLTPATEFFLFNELADLQPITASERAKLASDHPELAAMYSLKSYWVKQLNIMRTEGYEMIKDPRTRVQGMANLATFLLMVGAVQSLTFDWLRDVVLGRTATLDDYALAGMLRLVGISRYNLYKAKEGSYGDALASFFLPITGFAKDVAHDAGLWLHAIKGDKSPGSRSFGDYWEHAELPQYIPIVGRELYWRTAGGYTKEQQKKQRAMAGSHEDNTATVIAEMFNPPPKKK